MGSSSVVNWVQDFPHVHDLVSDVHIDLWVVLSSALYSVNESIYIPETGLCTFVLYITLRQSEVHDEILF
jgi:hypothetical protein